jgi:hypothetical protein
MTMQLGTSHQELRTRANKVRSAALDHDVERLHREATALLELQVDQERRAFDSVPWGLRRSG